MTQLEKMYELKNSISLLYEKEGRSISYIARLFNLDRIRLSKQIKEWEMKKANIKHVTPSTQKFINKNRELIISRLKNNLPITRIAKELNISRDRLNYILEVDEKLVKEKQEYDLRKINKKKATGQERNNFEELPGEIWKEILGFPNYFVSNKGRFKKYLSTYDCFKLLTCTPNCKNGRLYVCLYNEKGERKNLMAARIVAHAFCDGYSKINNTVDHKDRDVGNNDAINLEWVPQSINNKRAYEKGKNISIRGGKHGKFKEIILNNKYHFKTIRALANFLEVSETQAHRYIDKETNFDGKIELVY